MKDGGSLSSGFFSCDPNPFWAALHHPWRTWWRASAKHINMKLMLLALVEVIRSFSSAPGVSCLPVSMEVCLDNSLGSLRTFSILKPPAPHFYHLISCYNFPWCPAWLCWPPSCSWNLPCTLLFGTSAHALLLAWNISPPDVFQVFSKWHLVGPSLTIASPPVNRLTFANLSEDVISVSQFSCSVVSDSLQPHGLQHARFPCTSPTPRACSNSCPSSRWCHPTISSFVIPFSSCLQSFPASGSFPMSQLFASGGQSIGASALASVLPMNIQDWFPLGWTGWISLQSKGLSRVFSTTTVQKHQFFSTQLSLRSNSHIHTQLLEKP